MAKELIDSGYNYEVWHHVGIAPYRGCTCSNSNCDCAINHKGDYDFYTVKKTSGKIRTTEHKNMNEVSERLKQL